MKRLIFLVCLSLTAIGVNAQNVSYTGSEAEERFSDAKEIAYKDGHNLPMYIEFKQGAEPALSGIIEELKQKLELDSEIDFVLKNSIQDEDGGLHQKYSQSYKGHLIEIAGLNIHSKNGKVLSINATLFASTNAAGNDQLGEQRALEFALNNIGASKYKWEIDEEEKHLQMIMEDPSESYMPKGELVWMNYELNHTTPLRLCYKFDIYAHEPDGHYSYFVDASNGDIVFVENLIHTTDRPGTAQTGYSGLVNIIADSVSNYYRLRENGRGNGIYTFNMQNSTNIANAVDFIDSNNVWNAFPNVINKYAMDAHYGTEMTYDYFLFIHNRNSIDGNGFRLRSYVHYGNNYVNAFWNGRWMTYGDGNSTTSPLTTLDICGHEVTHGLTDRTSDLIYANESGALNESFSDIFGTCIEAYARPNSWNWTMGEEIGQAFRSMSNPNRYGDPDTYGGLNWIDQNCVPSSSNDQCGVHTNSGVQNYWFYLLTDGGSGTNDIGNSFNVNALGIIKAAKIAYRTNTVYLQRSSNFNDARFYSIKSAVDLFGACSPEVQEVTNAWYAVGVGKSYNPTVSAEFVATRDTSFCYSPVSVEFDSDGSNALTFAWDFGDGNTSTSPDPTHFYSSPGTYNVQLIADGGACGADTVQKQAYIRVDPSLRCSFFMGTDRVVTDCSGNLYDNGGLNGDYLVNSNDTITIAPTGADQVVLHIQGFDIEDGDQTFCNRDYLEIYDGEIGSAIIGKYCGNNLPPDSIVSSGKLITMVFRSDQSGVAGGFRSYWECKQAATPPVADFYSPLDSVCSAEVSFIDASTGPVTAWIWDFGDGNSSTEENPTHFYENDGTYTVSLTSSNSAGSNQVIKSNVITVQRLPMPMTQSDTACIGGRVKLGASGSGTLHWYDQAAGGTLRFQGDTMRINNLLSDTTLYVEYFQRPSSISGPFSISGNGFHTDTSEAIYFDVFEPMILESVILFSNKIGTRRIDLRNSSGQIIQTATLPVGGAPQQVTLNFVVYPDSNYSLSIGSSNPSLYVNTTGASYPYIFGNYMNLTGSSMGPNAYPFFYYWTIRPLTCYSSRALVEGKVDTSCVITDIEEKLVENSKPGIYPNPSENSFSIQNASSLDNAMISIYSLEGKLIKQESLLQGSDSQNKTFGADLPPAIYLISIQDGEEVYSFKWVKTN